MQAPDRIHFSGMPVFLPPARRMVPWIGDGAKLRVMNRRLVWFTIAVLTLVSAIAARSVYRSRRADANRAAVEAAFRKFSLNLKPGATRKDFLQAQGVAFMERCCYEPSSPFSVIVRVGEENAPWYCSEWPDYVAFEFVTTEPHGLGMKPSDSDVLKIVHLTSNGEGCL